MPEPHLSVTPTISKRAKKKEKTVNLPDIVRYLFQKHALDSCTLPKDRVMRYVDVEGLDTYLTYERERQDCLEEFANPQKCLVKERSEGCWERILKFAVGEGLLDLVKYCVEEKGVNSCWNWIVGKTLEHQYLPGALYTVEHQYLPMALYCITKRGEAEWNKNVDTEIQALIDEAQEAPAPYARTIANIKHIEKFSQDALLLFRNDKKN